MRVRSWKIELGSAGRELRYLRHGYSWGDRCHLVEKVLSVDKTQGGTSRKGG